MSPEQIAAKVREASTLLLNLGTGPLAELRRMRPGDVGPPAYWRIAAKCGLPDENADDWMQIVKIMALLAPKGERSRTTAGETPNDDRAGELRTRIHGEYPLGRALADGGDPDWKSADPRDPRGVFSEERLNRLTLTPAGSRGEALERIIRRLARSRSLQNGINCAHLARLILDPDDPAPMRKLAYDYFARLHPMTEKSESKKQGTA